MPRVYVSQAALDRWLTAGHVALRGDELHVGASPHPISVVVEAAVWFEGVESAGSGDDPLGVVGCVKGLQELERLGAEHFETSVVVGDHAYRVAPGVVFNAPAQDGVAHSGRSPLPWPELRALLAALG